MDPKEICSQKCRENCCHKIIFLSDYIDPAMTDQVVARYPFFELSGVIDVPFDGRYIRTYICKRWNRQTHLCDGYGIIPRPPLCERIGTTINYGNSCLLYNTLHPTPTKPPSRLSAFLSKHPGLLSAHR